jgi:phosphoribosyl 1,2-cyclic phosphate phosphodiesterase
MRLFFLGTSAAEGYPGIFCHCNSCTRARQLGGKNIRLRSALLVNDDLLIDFGPDLLASTQRFNQSLWSVTTGLVTHAHMDHFYPDNFDMRSDVFTGGRPPPLLHLYGPREVVKALVDNQHAPQEDHLEVHPVHAFDTWQRGRYSITAYRAYHAVETLEALFYSVEDGQHALLYATDTGSFTQDTRQALLGRSFDVIIMEETMGEGNYEQHLGFASFSKQVQWIHSAGLLRPDGRVIATHFSHSGNPLHEELGTIFNPQGVEVAYDGLEINL